MVDDGESMMFPLSFFLSDSGLPEMTAKMKKNCEKRLWKGKWSNLKTYCSGLGWSWPNKVQAQTHLLLVQPNGPRRAFAPVPSCTGPFSPCPARHGIKRTATVQHKKRTRDSDCESDCDNRFYSPTNMQQQVVGDMDLNEEQLFNQLFKARLGHPPYDKYESWYDIALWEEIVKELGSRSLFHNPTITDVLKVVIKYYKE
ncbi:hypothetical protein RYX36_028290 [Vicia faba]